MRHRSSWLSLGVLLMLLAMIPVIVTQAQETPKTVITLAVQSFQRDMLREPIERFEAENPDIDVELKDAGFDFYNLTTQDGITEALDGTQERVTAADVVSVSAGNITPELTRAGYFLDLNPLVRADTSFMAEDFFPALWNSFQWDGGLWAIPTGGSVMGLTYQPEAFDAEGLSYPDGFWTLDDLANAIRALNEYDSEGKVTKQGFINLSNGFGALLLPMAGVKLYDDSQFELVPDFDKPELEALLNRLVELAEEGLFDAPEGVFTGDAPLMIGGSFLAAGNENAQLAPLPGGQYLADANGLAVSAGTQNPEAAYRLVKFLTSDATASSSMFNVIPGRRSLVGVEGNDSGEGPRIMMAVNEALMTQMVDAMEQAIPMSQQLFAGRLEGVVDNMQTNGVDAMTALRDAEIEAADGLLAAAERKDTADISVIAPTPAPALNEGEIELTFGIQSFVSPFPNQEDWDALADNFAAADPQVGRVTYEMINQPDLGEITSSVDCFYQGGNIVPGADLSLLLAIDPLMANDPSFSRDDFVNGVLAQMQRDDLTWGMPLQILPQTLYYNDDSFNNAGAALPYNGWTVSDFEAALKTLKENSADTSKAPFEARGFGGTHLLTLIAAYGGLPMDYRTGSLTVNWTDEATIQAIQQVLDLAKDGYIKYDPLVATTGGFMMVMVREEGDEAPIPMYSQQFFGGFGGINIERVEGEGERENPYQPVLFPQGTVYNGIAYGVGGAYISAQTQYAEACYRFISALAQQGGILSGMPARRSLINAPETITREGQATVDFYNALDTLLAQPNTLQFPIQADANMSSIGESLVEYWMYKVFDEYVADETGNYDLAGKLAEAQVFADAYMECVAAIPPFEGSGVEMDYIRQFFDCSVKVDPTTESRFPPMN
jgi:ABC-type glycerol-3-phosphate transport system substrate-binding protein